MRRVAALLLPLAALAALAAGGSTTMVVAAAAVAGVVVVWPSSAGRWAAGAAGERSTAVALEGIEREGYTVLHDVRVPGKRWNIDHIVIGPAGVIVVETKQWRRTVRVVKRRPRILAERVSWQVEAVERALGLDPFAGVVHGFLCVHGAPVRRWWLTGARSAAVGDGRHLRRWLRRLPCRWGRRPTADVVTRAERLFCGASH